LETPYNVEIRPTYFDAMSAKSRSDAFRYRHHRSTILDVKRGQFARRKVFTACVTRRRQLVTNNITQTLR